MSFSGPTATCYGLLDEVGLDDNLAWKAHEMTFSRPGGWLSPLRFPALPAPLHGLAAMARNRGVLAWPDKLRVGAGLLWPILGNQALARRAGRLELCRLAPARTAWGRAP